MVECIKIDKLKKFAIIVAGGKGLRMGNEIPKQFLLLCGKPILMHTIECFIRFDNTISIIVVLPHEQFHYWEQLCHEHEFTIPHTIVSGGSERFYSVLNGLNAIDNPNALVAIHDGVRPLVSEETISRCFKVAEEQGNAVPAIPVVDSVRIISDDKNSIVDRNALRLIQTPQTFQFKQLSEAYNRLWHNGLTDDATVVELTGVKINLVEGNKENIKITSPFDLSIAESILAQI